MARQLLMEGYNPGWEIIHTEQVDYELPAALAERVGIPVRAKRTRFEAILQQGDTPNENKRKYAGEGWRKILADGSPFQERIKNREVFGEVEHPECQLSDNFRVLTAHGWMHFRDVKVGDKVWSRVNGRAALSDVHRIIDEPYAGPAFHVKSRAIDSGFTPNHRFLLKDRKTGGDLYATIGAIAANLNAFRHSPIPRTAEWKRSGPATITIPAIADGTPQQGHTTAWTAKQSQPLVLDAKLFAAFLGIYLAEGHCQPRSNPDNAYQVMIAQRGGWSSDYIHTEILAKFPEEIQWTRVGDRKWVATDARLHAYLGKLGKVGDKRIPREVMEFSVPALKELLFWFAIGDGRIYPSQKKLTDGMVIPEGLGDWIGKRRPDTDAPSFKSVAAKAMRAGTLPYTRMDLFSISEGLVRDLHEVLVRTGGCGAISTVEPDQDYEFAGRTIKAENKHTLWQLRVLRNGQFYLDPRFAEVEPVVHDGNVFCLQVTHGNFYMEQNGKAFWTGNSGNTALDRISHLFERVWYDDKTKLVHGEGIFLDTPGGRILDECNKVGSKIPFSSRGQGDVKQTNEGIDEVDMDGFYLDTFDAVYKPSVTRARTTNVTVPESARARVGESTTHQTRQPQDEIEFDLAQNLAPSHRVTTMETITEVGAGLIARGESILEAARTALTSAKPTIASLTESQAHISGLMATLGPVSAKPSEYAKELLLLKNRLIETSTKLNERIKTTGKSQTQHAGKQLASAEKLIESVNTTNKTIAEQNKKLKALARRQAAQLAEMGKYQAACKVMALAGQQILDEARALTEQNKDLTERLAAAESLLTEMSTQGVADTDGKVRTQLEKAKAFALARPGIKENAPAVAELGRCKTAADVKRVLVLVESTAGHTEDRRDYPPDLPPVDGGTRSLMEGGKVPAARQRSNGTHASNDAGNDLMSRSARRFATR